MIIVFDGRFPTPRPNDTNAGWIREFGGRSYLGRTRTPATCSTSAEWLAMLAAVERAARRHSSEAASTHLHLKTDSQSLRDVLLGNGEARRQFFYMKQRAVTLLQSFQSWTIEWVPRKRNKFAHLAAGKQDRIAWDSEMRCEQII